MEGGCLHAEGLCGAHIHHLQNSKISPFLELISPILLQHTLSLLFLQTDMGVHTFRLSA